MSVFESNQKIMHHEEIFNINLSLYVLPKNKKYDPKKTWKSLVRRFIHILTYKPL